MCYNRLVKGVFRVGERIGGLFQVLYRAELKKGA